MKKQSRYAFKLTVEAKDGKLYEIGTTYTAASERTARLQALIDALAIGHTVLNIEPCKRGASK